MQIRCITVGKASEPAVQTLQDEYAKRLGRWARLQWQLVPHQDAAQESARIMRLIKPQDFVILLDERGQQATTETMAQQLDTWLGSARPLVFVIGGAFGVDDDVRSRADYVWALSQLVFPHQLVRVLLSEQLYRMFSVRDGGKYHHGGK